MRGVHAVQRHVDFYALIRTWRRRTAIGVAAILLVAEVAVGGEGMIAGFADLLGGWSAPSNTSLEVGASLSIVGPSFSDRTRALAYAASVEKSDVPAFVQRLSGSRFRVLIGPYVSSSETESALRVLADREIEGGHLLVDDSLTTNVHPAAFKTDRRHGQPNIIATAAPGIVSIAFEVSQRPRGISAQRSTPTVLDVDVDGAGDVEDEQLIAPGGVPVVKSIELQRPSESGSDRIRFRIVVADATHSRVRVAGTRIYVDLATADPPWPSVRARDDGRALMSRLLFTSAPSESLRRAG